MWGDKARKRLSKIAISDFQPLTNIPSASA